MTTALSSVDRPLMHLPASLSALLSRPATDAAVLATSKDPNGKVSVLLFSPAARGIDMVVKVPSTELARAAVETEAHVLSQVGARIPSNLRTTIPTVLGFVEAGGHPALVVSGLEGTAMSVSYHRWHHSRRPSRVIRDFAVAGSWLRRLHESTAAERRPADMTWGGLVTAALHERFAAEHGFDLVAEWLSASTERLGRVSTPATVVHGDFWFGNILTSGDEVSGVVDWEHGTESGEPTRDVVRFALSYALYLDRHTAAGRRVAGHPGLRCGAWGAGVVYAVEGRGWFPNLFREFIITHLVRLGAPGARWHDAALAGVAEVAATADEPEFAQRHFCLLRELIDVAPRGDA